MLDPEVRRELRGLPKQSADLVARHLVVAGRLVDEDPAQALAHARAARVLAGRVGSVREALGVAAYRAGEYAEARAELRAFRRLTGSPRHLPLLADCERGLGRPDRALAVARDPAVGQLDPAERVELLIVTAGARRDLGQNLAAVDALEGAATSTSSVQEWTARLWYAYADALLAADRPEDARTWFLAAASADAWETTDAAERLGDLLGELRRSDPPGRDERPPAE